MTDVIIRFPGRPKPAAVLDGASAPFSVVQSRPAQILFFTGVRYERHSAEGASHPDVPHLASPQLDSPGHDAPKQGNGQRRRRRG